MGLHELQVVVFILIYYHVLSIDLGLRSHKFSGCLIGKEEYNKTMVINVLLFVGAGKKFIQWVRIHIETN